MQVDIVQLLSALEEAVPLQPLLGYVNFAEGKPDPRFQKQLNDVFAFLIKQGSKSPWQDLSEMLGAALKRYQTSGAGAFADIGQASAVLDLVFAHVLPAYRKHHADLLGHLSEDALWQPFFLARVFEAVLGQRGPWGETVRIVQSTLKQLNDYVGHRPIAILESRPRAEPYDHERFRPIPLYLRGAGTACGKHQAILDRALDLLGRTDGNILADACFDREALEEIALDPRGYDFHHPVDKRPNYCFGEWDPHYLDLRGRYCRYVVREVTLEGIWQRTMERGTDSQSVPREGGALDEEEVLVEAAAVLAGTVLMATGVSGASPTTHDSSVNLNNLVQRIARYREEFYAGLLQGLPGPHQERLRREREITRQPFGGARQYLNRFLAQRRALQMQQRRLALLYAEIGLGGAARRQMERIPVASVRLMTEIFMVQAGGGQLADAGKPAEAGQCLARIEDLLHRGITCGALVDPWNILGFQAQFPRFVALEDSVRDHRVDELMDVMVRLFNLYARVMSESAARGAGLEKELAKKQRKLADWWDRFATAEVGDVPRLHGGEAAQSAEQVARALGRWNERGEAAGDLAFWRKHLEGFRSAKAFSLVTEALLHKHDYRAAMALLMTWLSRTDTVPLEEGEHSFHPLALRWLLAVCTGETETAGAPPATGELRDLVKRFFDYLEANAEDLWNVPRLDLLGAGTDVEGAPDKMAGGEEDEDLYGAAYEGVTYKDSAADDVEGEVLDFLPQKDFDLTAEADRLETRLAFLTTLARLWNVATRVVRCAAAEQDAQAEDLLKAWLGRAHKNYHDLLQLLDTLHDHAIPKPTGAFEALVEFDRRRTLKERLLEQVIATCLDHAMAVGALRGALGEQAASAASVGPAWEAPVIQIERTLLTGQGPSAPELLPSFLEAFRKEPLLYTPLQHGGHPRHILRARIAQTILRGLVVNLPRQGLVRETYELLRTAQRMEHAQPLSGPRITEWDRLFHLGCQAMAEAATEAADLGSSPIGQGSEAAVPVSAERLVEVLESLTEPFLAVWMEHSRSLRVSVLEGITGENDWHELRDFIHRYGHDLFHARFLALGNLRAVLHRGMSAFLDDLAQHADPLHPIRLVDELERKVSRTKAELYLTAILQSLIENYDHYRDYASTTTQSDFGENLHQLLEFLRLKASYERHAWQLRPLHWVHEILARRKPLAADLWCDQLSQLTQELADAHLHELDKLEQTHGMRLATIRDRLEERFVKPLDLDRLCALVEPSLEQARGGGDLEHATRLEEELRPHAQTPTGVGLDVPIWLQRLHQEVQRLEAGHSPLAGLAGTLYQAPKVTIGLDDLMRQFQDWQQESKS